MSTLTSNLPKTSSQRLFKKAVKRAQQQNQSPATTPVYTSPTGVTYIKDEKTQQSIPISSPATPTVSSGTSSRRTSTRRSSSTPAPRIEEPAIIKPKPSTTTSTIIRRETGGTLYISDPITRTSRPLIQSQTLSKQTSPPKPASEIRGTTIERLPDGTSVLRPMTEQEQKKAQGGQSYTGVVLRTAKDFFTNYESRVRLGERYRQDVDTTFDFRPETTGTILGTGALLLTTITGAKGGAGLVTRTVTGISTVPTTIKTTATALKTAQASGRLTPFIMEGVKKGGTRLGITAVGAVGGGLGTAELSRRKQKEEIQALKELRDQFGFNIREEFREVRKGTEQAITPVRARDRDAFTQEAIRRGEAEGLTGTELTEYLRTTGADFQKQTQFAEPFYKGVVFDLPAGQLLVGQQAFKSEAKKRGQELGLTGQQLDAYIKGLDAERKARGFGELSSAVISTWGAEATGRVLNALTLKQFPAIVTTTSKAKAVGQVAKRTFIPTGIASGQEALITGFSEQILRGETLRTVDTGKLAREVGISAGVGGAVGGIRAGFTASRTPAGQITRPAKTAGLITDVFVYTADPFEAVGDVLESGRQLAVRKVLRRPVLSPVVEFADPSKVTGRFRISGVPDFPSVRTPKVPTPKIPDPRIESPKIIDPKIPDPKIPDPRIPDPVIPTPRIPTPKIPDPKIPTPKIPDPKIPDPKIPDPKIPDPRIPDPRIPSPRVPTLAFDWKMPPMLIPPLSLPTGSGGAGVGLGKRKTFVSELEQSQKLLGNLLGSGFTPQKINVPKKTKEDKKKKKKVNPYDVDNVFNKFFGVR
jgi:hypothetical protein